MGRNHHDVTDPTSNPESSDVCPDCGSASLATRIEDERVEYGDGPDRVTLNVSLPVRQCNDCGLSFMDASVDDVIAQALSSHLGLLHPNEIRAIRRSYGLSQAAFSKLTGIGEASLSRWERGSTVQSVAYDRYLYLLRYPENVARLRSRAQAADDCSHEGRESRSATKP